LNDQRFDPWTKSAIVEVRCAACRNSALLAQIERRDGQLRWHKRSIGIQRFGRRLDRNLTSEVGLPVPKNFSEEGTAEFFAVVCVDHGPMLPPLDELERGIKTTPTTTVRVSPDRHRYTYD
jgi:hypothetical protein